MRRLTSVFATTTLVAAITSVYLWQQLHAERVMTAQLQERVAQLELAPGRSMPTALANQQPDARQKSAAEQAAPGASGTKAVARTVTTVQGNAPLIINSSELMKDPDYREGLAISLRGSLAQNYPDLARELDLTPEQVGKLFDLMTKQQLASMANSTPVGADDATMREAMSARQEISRKQDAEMAALLGDTKYQQFKDYQQSQGARQQVRQLSTALESSGQPLGEQQQRQLTAALATEQKRQQQDMMQSAQAGASSTPRDQAAMMEESLKRTEDNNRKTLDVASAYLNSQQLDAYRKMQAQQLGMSRAFMRAQQAQQAAQGQSGASAAAGGATVIFSN